MRIYKLNGGYSFEYELNKNTDVQVIVTDLDQVTITHYTDDDEFEVMPSPEEKEKWLNKVEDIKLKRLKIEVHLFMLDELSEKIDSVKKEMLSILDPEEDNDLIAAIENGKTTGEIEKLLER